MIGRRERWSYASGDLGFNFVWQSAEFYLLFFYVRGLGLSPGGASAIFLAGAALDWITDPAIGAIADRMAPRVPLRMWVGLGGPAAVLLLSLAFVPWQKTALPVWPMALITYLALRVAYSIGNIPYAALTARLSAEPADHLALTATRMQAAAIGGLVATALYAVLTPHGSEMADFRLGALILAALSLPAFLLTAFGVRERISPAKATIRGKAPGIPLLSMVALIRNTPALRRLLMTIIAAGLIITGVDKALLFLFEERGLAHIGYFVAPMPSAALLLSAPLWRWAGRRFGHRHILLTASALTPAALAASLLIPGPGALMALVVIVIVANAGMGIMFWTIVPTVVARCETDNGDGSHAARIYALCTVARKFAQAMAPQVIALALILPGLSVLGAITGMAIFGALLIRLQPPES